MHDTVEILGVYYVIAKRIVFGQSFHKIFLVPGRFTMLTVRLVDNKAVLVGLSRGVEFRCLSNFGTPCFRLVCGCSVELCVQTTQPADGGTHGKA